MAMRKRDPMPAQVYSARQACASLTEGPFLPERKARPMCAMRTACLIEFWPKPAIYD